MKRFFLIAMSAALLQGCLPEPRPTYKYESQNFGAGVVLYCCKVTGNTCVGPTQGAFGGGFRTYVENDNLAGYFQNEYWQSTFPELIDRPDLVQAIIDNNPKGMYVDNFAFVILKDRQLPPDTDNVLVAFKMDSKECDDWFNSTN
jgi:hypothetical protein